MVRPRRRAPEPPPPPARQNWLAAGLNLVAAALALLSLGITPLLGLFGGAYGVGLAMGTWFVRPAERGRRVFSWLMMPLILQAALYVLYWYPIATASLSGGEAPPSLETAGQRAAFQAALAALALGWVPSVLLRTVGRQAKVLVTVQILGPGAAMVFQVMSWVSI